MPCVISDIGSSQWIALAAADRIRRKKPFHALEVSVRCAVALVHVAAADPFRAGRHTDLIARAVVANRSANRVSAMATVVARKGESFPHGLPTLS